MAERVERDGLKVASELADFIEKRALPGTGVRPALLGGVLETAA
jgi:malate synthase